MNKQEHTPGPWRAGPEYGNRKVEIGVPGKALATVWVKTDVPHGNGLGIMDDPEGWANARLIAAAPELLEALEGAIGALEMDVEAGGDVGCAEWVIIATERLHRARAAIAKARGQE